ncbi:MAG: DUF2865 domain-containing protein [Hyphomicrobiaceae bacterium]
MSANELQSPQDDGKPGMIRRGHVTLRRRAAPVGLGVVGSLAIGIVALAGALAPAHAQSWWPFGGNDEPARPVPREPVYRQPPPAPAPQAQPQPGPDGTNWATRNPICLQLEQRLVQEGQKGSQSRDALAQVEAERNQVDRAFNVGASKLDANCYETFLFTRSFRNTPQCKELAKQVEVSKRRLAELEAQRQDLASGRSYQDDIIRELARNNCGANYADQARRRDNSGMWSEEGEISTNNWTPYGSTGETYRTVCVRLCDGYYFPVSFSTLPSHFAQDAEVCSSKCAAPAQLYYYRNPGGTMDQAVALQTSDPYTKLKSAFRYRKEYVNGCSCKEAEFVPTTTAADQKAETGKSQPITTGSTTAAPPPAAPPSNQEGAQSSGWEAQSIPPSEGD